LTCFWAGAIGAGVVGWKKREGNGLFFQKAKRDSN
jgi:hypothetical protein